MTDREQQLQKLDDFFLKMSTDLFQLRNDIIERGDYNAALTNAGSQNYIIRWIAALRDEIRIIRESTLKSLAETKNPGKVELNFLEANDEFEGKLRERVNEIVDKWFPEMLDDFTQKTHANSSPSCGQG